MKKILLIIIIAAAAAAGVLVVLNMSKQKQALDAEALKIRNMDIRNEEIDMTIHTTGDYMAVEDVMKCYIDEYLKTLEVFESIPEDERLLSMLSTENLVNDGPDFTQSRTLLETMREKLDAVGEKLVNMAKEENILRAIDTSGVSGFQRSLYEKEMKENIGPGFFYPGSELEKAKENMQEKIDNIEAVINFLTENKGKWSVENNTLKFSESGLFEQYMQLVEKVK